MEVRLAASLVARTQCLSLSTSSPLIATSTIFTRSKRTIGRLRGSSCRRLFTQPQHQQQTSRGGTAEGSNHTNPSNDASNLRTRQSTIPGLPLRKSGPGTSSAGSPTPKPASSGEGGGSSYTDMLKESQVTPPRPSETLSSWGAPSRRDIVPRTGARYTSLGMAFPDPIAGTETRQVASRPRVVRELDIHVKPRTGRSLRVDPQRSDDLGARLQQLDMLCARNSIRRDANKQKFHERPGLKRKRLTSERWRREFKTRFALAACRINDIRKQGW